MSAPLLIYVAKDTPRVRYIFSLFFESLVKTTYGLTTDVAEYSAHNGPKLNYSDKPIAANEIFIKPVGLLFETGIKAQSISVTDWEGLKVFYQSEGNLPFDVFFASFYLVSRYEEYLATSLDQHKRFKATESLAFKNHFLDVPIVNLWAEKLKAVLKAKFPSIVIEESKYSFAPTIDVDVAYAHKGRTAAVTIGSSLKALAKFDFSTVGKKRRTLSGTMQDEYDTYEYQRSIFARHNLKPIYFFLAGERNQYDKNIATDSPEFASLVKQVSEVAEVGIHPSYNSASGVEVVKKEVEKVQRNLKEKITKSRQHFLRVMLPETYRCLAELGITDDYTMAYAGCPGFRAGICTPFYFYDLKDEKVLPVKLHSTIVMDGTLNEYLAVSPDEAIALSSRLIESVKAVKGEFICIWHNDTLNDNGKWKGWRRVFETMIEKAK